ncbi:pickpocket protein 28-like [Nilaparvata lugens]|uniref:pickpocket protein 28-like n=1 Tax=Nilaparvata lugens TaxID=108931 RepID=UPI00193D847A|nr:pickpocket protein 28-like [Nilaparvata lugens]
MPEAASTPHQRQMRRRKRVNPHFKNFVENTSLHGVKYIFGGNQHWIKRAYWCIVVIGFVISLFTIYTIKMKKWKESPMKIELANTPQSISTLPIPALTICGPIRSTSFYIFRNFLKKHYSDEIYKIVDILGMSGEAFDEKFSFSHSTEKYTNKSEKRFVIADSILEQFFHDASKPGRLSIESAFGNKFSKSSTFMFRGHCLTSNMIPLSKIYRKHVVRNFLRNDLMERDTKKGDWVTDTIHGFPSFTENRTSSSPLVLQPNKYPTLMPLNQSLMSYEIKYDYDDKLSFGDYFIGRDNSLRFTIHNPWEVPNPFMRWHRLHLSKGSRIHIEPEQIMKYPVDENDFLYKVPYTKQCYNTTERTLDFFQYYTRQNCLMECSTKRALRECGCVLFFMPHNESTYICSDEHSSCVLDVAKATHYDTGERTFVDSCDCLPSCNYTDYKVLSYELFQNKVSGPPQGLIIMAGLLGGGIRPFKSKYYNKRAIEIVFRDIVLHPKVRTFTYNNYEMMDSTVFYLDTFLGISIMTIAEMFYYILLFAIDYLKRKIQLMIDSLHT